MSWTPYDYEAEERRDSERFADASVFDGPDPSEYMDYPAKDGAREIDENPAVAAVDKAMRKAELIIERPIHKPGMIDENAMLNGLLGMLFAVLAGLMLWILVGAAVMRWVL